MEKKELTVTEAIEQKMTFEDVVRHYKPEATQQEAEYILWNETCYPFDAEMTIKQIFQYFNPTYLNESTT